MMKTTLFLRTITVVAACITIWPTRTEAYSFNLVAGYNAVGNHNNLNPGPNNMDNFLVPMIDGLIVLKLGPDRQDWVYAAYDSGFGGWVDSNFNPIPTPTFDPGEGLFMYNPLIPVTVNVSGSPAGGFVSTPPLNTWRFVCRKTDLPNTLYQEIFGAPPPPGFCTILMRWGGAVFNIYTYREGLWFPSEPELRIGEPALVEMVRDNLMPFAPISAAPNCALNQIILSFNRDFDQTTAGLSSQYTVTPGGLTVTSVSFDSSTALVPSLPPRRVFLNLSAPLIAGTTYKVTTTSVKDLCGNLIQPGAFTKFKANQTVPRLILAEPDCNHDEIIVTYDRPMGVSAENSLNYTLLPSGSPPIVSAFLISASAGPSGANRVRLKLGAALNPSQLYTLQVNSVSSACGGALPPSATVSFICDANISGMKYSDVNGDGNFTAGLDWPMPNWVFKLDTATPTTPRFAVTDINGNYRFSVPQPPPPGGYNLTDVLKPAWAGPLSGGTVHNITTLPSLT